VLEGPALGTETSGATLRQNGNALQASRPAKRIAHPAAHTLCHLRKRLRAHTVSPSPCHDLARIWNAPAPPNVLDGLSQFKRDLIV
jgi:hypothetical protein